MDQVQHRGLTHVKSRRTKCSHHDEEAPGICASPEKISPEICIRAASRNK